MYRYIVDTAPAGDPDAGRGGGAGVRADAPDPGRHLRGPAGLAAARHVDPAALAACRQQLGLDDPLIVQFLDFLWSFATFDFGISMWSGKPVVQEIATRLPVSLRDRACWRR